jgi:sugar phosphate isomerase/epimerase
VVTVQVGDLPGTWSLGVASFDEPLKSGQLSTRGFLLKARELGFGAVELCDLTVDHARPQRTRALLEDLGLACPSVAVRNDFTTATMCQADLEKVLAWLEPGRQVGAAVLRVSTGWRAVDQAARRRVERAFDQLVPVAGRLGLLLAVETHGGLSNDVAFLRSLVGRYHGGVGVCMDFGNVPVERHLQYVEALAPIVRHVHVKSYEFGRDGRETTLDLPRCLRVLKEQGHTGQWVVEYEGKPPYEEGVRRTVDAMVEALL